MLRVFSVKSKLIGSADAKYVIMYIQPNKMIGVSYATNSAGARAVQNILLKKGSRMIQAFAANDHKAIEAWKERARKNGYFTSYQEAKAAGAKI